MEDTAELGTDSYRANRARTGREWTVLRKSLWKKGLFAKKEKVLKKKERKSCPDGNVENAGEAAFPTFPQGPPPKPRKQTAVKVKTKKQNGAA